MTLRTTEELIQLATLYYRDGLTQVQLAKRFGVSRPTIAAALKRCKEEGIVEIRIKEPESLTGALGEELAKAFGLNKAIVVKSGADLLSTTQRIGAAAAEHLAAILQDGTTIGLSWGTSLYHMVQQLPACKLTGIEVVQLLGALGSDNPQFDGFELAMNLAARLQGTYSIVQAPTLVRTAELKKMLLQEPTLQEALRRAETVDIALVGVSANSPEYSALVRAGYLTEEDANDVLKAGAVGHVCGHHIDIDGQVVKADVNERLVGIGPEALRAIPNVIGIAGGIEKTDALLGTLRSGMLKMLVTDEAAALRVLKKHKKQLAG